MESLLCVGSEGDELLETCCINIYNTSVNITSQPKNTFITLKDDQATDFVTKFHDFLDSATNPDKLDELIEEALISLNASKRLNGFETAKAAVKFYMDNPRASLRGVYKALAEASNTSPRTIEARLHHLIEDAFNNDPEWSSAPSTSAFLFQAVRFVEESQEKKKKEKRHGTT